MNDTEEKQIMSCHMTMELRLPSFYMLYKTMFKGIVHLKTKHMSLLTLTKHVGPSFIFWTQTSQPGFHKNTTTHACVVADAGAGIMM